MLFSTEITEHIRNGGIVISPFNHEFLGTNSYDVTLGDWFYREQHPVSRTPFYNIYDEESVARVWGAPDVAETAQYLQNRGLLPFNLKNIAPHDKVILIGPGETILAHTNEYIGGLNSDLVAVTTKMHARSSIGRSMLGVCKCAGLGDVGFINRWTMEITSFSKYHWIPLIVGRRIAQIEFTAGHPVTQDCIELSGKYSKSTDLEELQRTWKPMMMLPRLFMDKELRSRPTVQTPK